MTTGRRNRRPGGPQAADPCCVRQTNEHIAPLLMATRDAAISEPEARQVWQEIGLRRGLSPALSRRAWSRGCAAVSVLDEESVLLEQRGGGFDRLER
jgi:hypothetical protein